MIGDDESFEGFAPGKVILLGEHAVVHGVSAIAASIGRGAQVRIRSSEELRLQVADVSGPWELQEDSDLYLAYRTLNALLNTVAHADARIDIPVRAGLGSSACLGVALVRALLQFKAQPFTQDDVMQAAMAWEKVFHGTPSGIDVAVALEGGCIEFSRTKGIQPLRIDSPIPLCIGDSGTRSCTRAMVEHVTVLLDGRKDRGKAELDAIASLVDSGKQALAASNWTTLGFVMKENQRWLQSLGLVNPQVEALCSIADSAGASGTKVTGAGGGGCVIALAPDRGADILNAWQHAGFKGFFVNAGV